MSTSDIPKSLNNGTSIRTETFSQIVNQLSDKLSIEPSDTALQNIGLLLADIIHGVIEPQDAPNYIGSSPEIKKLINELSSKQIQSGRNTISFGSGNNIGNVNISGDVAGGSVIKINILNQNKILDEFKLMSINELKRFEYPRYIPPNNTNRLLSALLTTRRLIIYGERFINEAELARYIGLRFARELQERIGKVIDVFDWARSAPLRDLNVIIEQRNETSVFILTQITPELNGVDFFSKLMQSHHYVIITSDVSFSRWNLPDGERNKWIELPKDGLYTPQKLVDKLISDIKGATQDTSAVLVHVQVLVL
ncbi:MAG: hypothetical protein MUD01_17000, partial [Chloroflexaceae bacterium]|nr:hypothetical protein [Chloroflexaceae bacterium]